MTIAILDGKRKTRYNRELAGRVNKIYRKKIAQAKKFREEHRITVPEKLKNVKALKYVLQDLLDSEDADTRDSSLLSWV